MNNIVFIAAAGSGKTTKLVNMAIEKSKTERVLITTYTNENEQEIKKKFYKMNSYIPKVSVNSSLNYSTHSPRILKGVISMFQGSSLFQSSAV